jgi:hypothetical protein
MSSSPLKGSSSCSVLQLTCCTHDPATITAARLAETGDCAALTVMVLGEAAAVSLAEACASPSVLLAAERGVGTGSFSSATDMVSSHPSPSLSSLAAAENRTWACGCLSISCDRSGAGSGYELLRAAIAASASP